MTINTGKVVREVGQTDNDLPKRKPK